MSYSDANMVTFRFTAADMTQARTFSMPCSKGKKGRLRDVYFSALTATAGATTTPRIQVGRAGSLTRYADMDVGLTAAGRGKAASLVAGALKNEQTGATPVSEPEEEILVTIVPPTGAGAAGGGDIHVRIDMF